MVQWLRLCLPMQEVQVWSLVGELRSYMPCGPKTKNIKQKGHCKKFKTYFKSGPHKKIFKKVYKNFTAQWVWKECIHLWNQHHDQDTLHFRHQKFPHFTLQFNPSSPPQSSGKSLICFLSVLVYNNFIYMEPSFLSGFQHVFEKSSMCWAPIFPFNPLTHGGLLGYLQLGTIMNNLLCKSLYRHKLSFLWKILGNSIF